MSGGHRGCVGRIMGEASFARRGVKDPSVVGASRQYEAPRLGHATFEVLEPVDHSCDVAANDAVIIGHRRPVNAVVIAEQSPPQPTDDGHFAPQLPRAWLKTTSRGV